MSKNRIQRQLQREEFRKGSNFGLQKEKNNKEKEWNRIKLKKFKIELKPNLVSLLKKGEQRKVNNFRFDSLLYCSFRFTISAPCLFVYWTLFINLNDSKVTNQDKFRFGSHFGPSILNFPSKYLFETTFLSHLNTSSSYFCLYSAEKHLFRRKAVFRMILPAVWSILKVFAIKLVLYWREDYKYLRK